MKEETMYTSIWIALFTATAITIICCTYFYLRHGEEMAKIGYEQTTIKGLSGSVWAKSELDTLRGK